MTGGPARRTPSERAFRAEIRRALRYETGLAIKTGVAIALVAAILLMHVYLFG